LGNFLSVENRSMSTRERWIVYPLLFLALGAALRDKLIPPGHLGNPGMQFEAGTITTPRLRCQGLQAGQVVCERLMVNGPNDRPVIIAGTDNANRAGIIETFTAGGIPQVRLGSSDSGGMVTTIERAGKLALFLGDTGKNFGVFAELPGLGQLIPLTIPWRFESKPGVPKPPKQPASAAPVPSQRSSPKSPN
jgi:hypothetical protein